MEKIGLLSDSIEAISKYTRILAFFDLIFTLPTATEMQY